MQPIRTRARMVALVWLMCQAATLAAFVPENCCVAHAEERAAKEKAEACHDAEPPAPKPGDACPMSHAEDDACPMHSSRSANCCAMSNACDGPGQHLTTLFVYMATVERPVTTDILRNSVSTALPAVSPLINHSSTPDAPPPRA
jgi:hypothetical protein